MKRICLLLLLFPFCVTLHAQKFIQLEDKAFNFGAKVGFNSTFPIINSLTINNVQAENIQIQYRVGYLAAVFCRVNIDRFFIQPDLSWYHSEGDIRFTLPATPTDQGQTLKTNQLTFRNRSLELPVMIGYYLVKESPYALSLMVGPKLKYNYKEQYTSYLFDRPNEYISDNQPLGLNIATGLGVSIWRLFFDITYEFGINKSKTDFKDESLFDSEVQNISISKRTNVMSISLGFLF